MSRMKFFLILLVVMTQACTESSQARALTAKGKQAYEQKNYQAAFQDAYAAATKGNPDAEYALGYLYYNGLGIKRDQSKALHWFKKAAKLNQSSAINALQIKNKLVVAKVKRDLTFIKIKFLIVWLNLATTRLVIKK